MKLRSERATLQDMREARFSKELQCPRCGSTQVKRNGKFTDKKGYVKQRYLCKGCRRTFNDLTGTPLAYSKKQDLWGKMASGMVKGLSVRKTAARLKINKWTAASGVHLPYQPHQRFYSRLKTWMARFKGMATKYLAN